MGIGSARKGFAEDLKVGATPSLITLDGDEGGLVKGGGWSSASIKERLHVLFYVDPDNKDLNEDTAQALKNQNYGPPLQSLAIINMAATWLPNAIINSSLKSKQEEYPHTIYIKDMHKAVVKNWGLKDNSSDIVLFGKDGKVLFRKDGKLSTEDTSALMDLIRKNL